MGRPVYKYMAWPAAIPHRIPGQIDDLALDDPFTSWRFEAKDGDNQPIKPRAHNHRGGYRAKEPGKRKDDAITRCN